MSRCPYRYWECQLDGEVEYKLTINGDWFCWVTDVRVVGVVKGHIVGVLLLVLLPSGQHWNLLRNSVKKKSMSVDKVFIDFWESGYFSPVSALFSITDE